MKRTLTLACLFLFTTSFAQTLVNQTVPDTMGIPSHIYEYTKILPIGNGNFVVLDNDYNSANWPNDQGFNLAEINPSTGLVGGFNFFALHGEGDYGTNMCIRNGLLYAVGVTTDSLFHHSISCNLYVVNISTFDTVFTLSMSVDSAVQQAPFSILADDSGYIYMGASVQTATDYKIALLKFDSAGHEIWESSYDTAGLYTIPVAMAFSGSGNTIAVTGFSFDSMGHSNFVTVDFTTGTGHMYGYKTSANGNGMVSHPCGILTDTSGSTIIAGTSTVAGTTSIVKVVAYDTLFNQMYVSTYGDSSQTNTAAAMCGDLHGHVWVTGSSPNASGGTNLTVMEFNTADGSIAWSRTLSAPNPAGGMSGVGITNSSSTGSTYVTGTVSGGVDTNIITAAFDTGGNLLWMKTFARTSASTDVPYSITTGDGGTPVYVTARSYASDSLYIMLEYDEWAPTPCGDSVCPSITYVFENGKLDTVGSDTFVEFDIYARQNEPGLNYKGGNIVFTYSNSIFGTDVVDSGNILVTPGTITDDTNAYSITINDTLFKSNAVPSNGGEVWLSIASIGSPYYAIADTLQQLCHVKMKLKHKGTLQIYFDRFFMQEQSEYLSLTSQEYTNVYTGPYLSPADNVSLTYNVVNRIVTIGNTSTISFDIAVEAGNDVPVAGAGVALTFDSTVISFNPNNGIFLPSWMSYSYSPNSNSSGPIYSIYPVYTPTGQIGSGQIYFQIDTNANSSPYDPTDANVHHFTSAVSETFISVIFTILNCNGYPNLRLNFPAAYRGLSNYYGISQANGNYITANYTPVMASSSFDSMTCALGINNINEGNSVFSVYPNPFSQVLTVDMLLIEGSDITIDIINILGQHVYTQALGKLSPGSHTQQINMPDEISNGFYYINLSDNNSVLATFKVIKE